MFYLKSLNHQYLNQQCDKKNIKFKTQCFYFRCTNYKTQANYTTQANYKSQALYPCFFQIRNKKYNRFKVKLINKINSS